MGEGKIVKMRVILRLKRKEKNKFMRPISSNWEKGLSVPITKFFLIAASPTDLIYVDATLI